MPYLHVRSLPLRPAGGMRRVVEGLTLDFARDAGIAPEYVSATWQFLPSSQYAVAGRASGVRPVMVDLLTPDFNRPAHVARMLAATADSIARRAGVPRARIFICHFAARSGHVFDSGRIERW